MNNNNNNLPHILRLYRSENIGPVTYRLLVDKYGVKNSIEALENILKEIFEMIEYKNKMIIFFY